MHALPNNIASIKAFGQSGFSECEVDFLKNSDDWSWYAFAEKKNGYDLIFCNSMAGLEEALDVRTIAHARSKQTRDIYSQWVCGVIDACGSIDFEKGKI